MNDLIACDCRSELESNDMSNDIEVDEQTQSVIKTPGNSSIHQFSGVLALEHWVMH
jgi:hypothetical protein